MFKFAFALLFSLLIYGKTYAQVGKDTVVYFMKNDGQKVDIKDDADYILFNLPFDPNTGLYKVVEINKNGTPRLITNSRTRVDLFKMEGVTTIYFPNGKKRSVGIYKNGEIAGDVVYYYPNGKFYMSLTLDTDKLMHISESRDSTGKPLVDKGNGEMPSFNNDFTHFMKGKVVNGLPEGEWHGSINDTGRFVCNYIKGALTYGTGYDKTGKAYPFTKIYEEPVFPGGMDAFHTFLIKTFHYPYLANLNLATGRYTVYVKFTIDKDGSVTDVSLAQKPPSESIGKEIIRTIKLSPKWTTAYQYGMPIQVKYTIPIHL